MARPIQMNPATGAVDEPDPLAPTATPQVPIPGYIDMRQGGGKPAFESVGSPVTGAGQAPPVDVNNDANTMDSDQVGDIPPPPIPERPQPLIQGPGVAGIPGTEAGTFARPGSMGAVPFRSPAYVPKRPPRFGPGVANVGGGAPAPTLDAGTGIGISPDDAAELLRSMAGGRGGF